MEAIIDYRGKSPTKTTFGVPLITAKVVKGGRIDTPDEFIAVADYDSWMRRGLPKPGDVVITTEAPLGEVAQLDGRKVALAQRLIALRGKAGLLDNTYLKFVVQSAFVQDQLKARATGTTVLGIRQSELRKVLIPHPPYAEQRRIADILGSLDDKIELNRRTNETLEAMARTLFRSWFVDFDPVRAKADGQKPQGMDAATAKLFPDSFEPSALGPIPKGWRVGVVGDNFNVTMGQSPPGETYNETGDGTPFFQGRAEFGFRFPTVRLSCTAPTRFAERGDSLVSVRAPVGDVNLADRRCCIGRGLAAVRHHSGSRSFTYYAMRELETDFARFEAEGTVFGSINKADFLGLRLVVPPAELVTAFERFAFPLDQRIEALTEESVSLAATRDALLPRLLSGEITT